MIPDELDEAILAATAHEMREDDPARRMAVHLLTIVLQQELARRSTPREHQGHPRQGRQSSSRKEEGHLQAQMDVRAS